MESPAHTIVIKLKRISEFIPMASLSVAASITTTTPGMTFCNEGQLQITS